MVTRKLRFDKALASACVEEMQTLLCHSAAESAPPSALSGSDWKILLISKKCPRPFPSSIPTELSLRGGPLSKSLQGWCAAPSLANVLGVCYV